MWWNTIEWTQTINEYKKKIIRTSKNSNPEIVILPPGFLGSTNWLQKTILPDFMRTMFCGKESLTLKAMNSKYLWCLVLTNLRKKLGGSSKVWFDFMCSSSSSVKPISSNAPVLSCIGSRYLDCSAKRFLQV